MNCLQEMCGNWGGDGCVCAVLGLDPDDQTPCRWCDRAIGKRVTRGGPEGLCDACIAGGYAEHEAQA